MAVFDGSGAVGASETLKAKRRRSLLVAMLFAVAALALGVSASLFLQPSRASHTAGEVANRLNALDITPAAVNPVIEKALQARRAIVAGDFASADSIVDDVLGASQMQGWRFYPFDDFIEYVMKDVPFEFGGRLDDWVAKDGTNATPLLLRGQYSHDLGWDARGRGFIDTVSADGYDQFDRYLTLALSDVNAALAVSDANPFGFYLRLRILRREGPSQGFFRAFNDAVAKYPDYYPLYELALTALQPRWGGAVSDMTRFVEDFAGHAAPSSPLRLLQLSLYRHLLDTASVGCQTFGVDERSSCVSRLMRDMGAESLEAQVLEALKLYDHTDKYQFGLALKPIISDMLNTPGGDSYSGAALELAAISMHSDTRLMQKRPGRNDYIVDELVAISWEQKGFRENAEAKYREALVTAQSAVFPSEHEKNRALAGIYEALAEAAAEQKDYLDAIVFDKASALLGVPWRADRICGGYYRLEDYQGAITSCTEALAATDNANAFFWRGAAYDRIGQADAALADLKKAADDTRGKFRVSAAIQMSMVHFNRGDIKGALDVLNTYTFLYDPALTIDADVAVAFNNRCYAYMELGELEKALADCTQSLRYGSIPDAFRKQQELVALLRPPATRPAAPIESTGTTQ